MFLWLATPLTAAEPWRFEDVVANALETHPLVVAARERRVAAEGSFTDAGRWSNPVLQMTGENLRLGADDFQASQEGEWFVFVSQLIETGGRRGHRKRAAESDVRIATLDLRIVEREVLHRIKVAYQNAVAAQEATRLSRESWDRLERLVELNRVRSTEGYVAEGDYIKSRVEAQRFESSLRRAELDLERAKFELLSSLGRTEFDTGFELAAPPLSAAELDVAALRESALRRPELLMAEAVLERAGARVGLAGAEAYPNVTTQVGYKRNGPDNTLYAGVIVPLPIFSRNQGGKLSAQANLGVARAEVQLWRSQALGELEAALEGVRLTRERIESLQAGFVSGADESQAIALAAYREGAADLLVVLEAERTRNAAQELVVEALHEHRVALHALERAASVRSLPRHPVVADEAGAR